MNVGALDGVLRALVGEVADELVRKVRPIIAEEVRGALAEQAEHLQPLDVILNCTASAARVRLSRDTELRALGLQSGRRLVFRPSEVRAFLAARNQARAGAPRRAPRVRVVRDGAES